MLQTVIINVNFCGDFGGQQICVKYTQIHMNMMNLQTNNLQTNKKSKRGQSNASNIGTCDYV